jgi:hypothetical protein
MLTTMPISVGSPPRRLLAVVLAVLTMAAILTTVTAGPEPAGAQATSCVTATNQEHVDAGRATQRLFIVRAAGSGDFLGLPSSTTTLQQDGSSWTRVDDCGPGGTTTTTEPGEPGDRDPLTPRYSSGYRTDTRLPGHTVYQPDNLDEVTDLIPIVVWGNGACRADGTWFRAFLEPLAGYGVLVIASGRPNGSGSTNSDMLIDAMDWAIAENSRSDSQYEGRLDTEAVVAMGQSCGGLEAIDASSDPRVSSTILWNSGIFPGGIIGGVTKAALNDLHSPVAWLDGGPSDIAHGNAADDYSRVPNRIPAVHGSYGNVGHSAMFSNHTITNEIVGVAANWIDATAYDDPTARAQFVGPNCGLCSATQWSMQSKNW